MKNVLVCIDLGGTVHEGGSASGGMQDCRRQCVLPVHQDFEELSRGDPGIRRPDEREIYSLRRAAFSAPGAVDVQDRESSGAGARCPASTARRGSRCSSERTGVPASVRERRQLRGACRGGIRERQRSTVTLAFVVCGTGIGGAVVIDRKIHYGANLYGGEFGCMVMRDENGKI